MEGVTCPIEGCDYQNTPRSVEAHISSATDEAHSGEVGRTYRGRFGEMDDGDADRDDDTDQGDDESEPGPPGVPVMGVVLVAVILFAVTRLRSSRTGTEKDEPSPTPQFS